MSEKNKFQEMSAAELQSMLKSSINFKGCDGIKARELNLSEEDMKWWLDAKVGLFIHWGLYSILAEGEWVMHNKQIPAEEYAKLAEEFNPGSFNAEEWAKIAKDAGAKYSVMVTRHHDGFAMWDSKSSYKDFTSAKTAAKRDFVKCYVEAFRNEGIAAGLYYSPMDWRFPGYFHPKEMIDNANLLKKQCYDQVEELVSQFGEISILWYDGGWLAHAGCDADAAWLWEPVKLNKMVRSYQPKIVINPRSGWEGDFKCDEGSRPISGQIVPFPWEKCFTLGGAWGYTTDEEAMPIEQVLSLLINASIRNGNTLINVGPDRDGKIPENITNVLKQLGNWLKEKGESIYGTRGGPIQPVDSVYGTTYRDNLIYLHILDNIEFNKLMLPELKQKILNCQTLEGINIDFEQSSRGVKVLCSNIDFDGIDTIIKIELDAPVV
jgi:alpha-L-fucosidase